MTHQAVELKHKVLESELEALLIEAELIRTHQPFFNILLKDDKSPLYIHITDDLFPKILTVRKKEIEKHKPKGTILGPFPSAYKVKEVLKIARYIFPWCNQAGNKSVDLPTTQKPKACFYFHLGLCPGACVGEISPAEYLIGIMQLTLFLKGKKKEVLRNLEKAMQTSAAEKKYESAAQIRDSIGAIRDVTKPQYQLKPDTVLPQLKMDRRAEALIHLSSYLSTYLSLPKSLHFDRIEGYDVSNTQGTNASVAMVTFIDGQPAPQEYRLFNIRTIEGPNDYGMMKEALERRQNNPDWGQPDLLVIDGGKGQLRAALSVWHWACPVISIAKDPDRLVFAHPETTKSGKVSYTYTLLKLNETEPVLQLIQHIRDEAHRFSKKQHSLRRTKSLFQ